jgi:hypothetical protein
MKDRLRKILQTQDYKDYLVPIRLGVKTVLVLDYNQLSYALRCTNAELRAARRELEDEGFKQKSWTNTWDSDKRVTVLEVLEYLIDFEPQDFIVRGTYNEYRWNFYKMGRKTGAQLKTLKAAVVAMGWPLDPNAKPNQEKLARKHIREINKFLPEKYQTAGVYIALLSSQNIEPDIDQLFPNSLETGD